MGRVTGGDQFAPAVTGPPKLMKNSPKLSHEQVEAAAAAIADPATDDTATSVARDLDVARSTLRDALDRLERERTERHEPGAQEQEDGAITVTSDPLTVAGVELTEDALF